LNNRSAESTRVVASGCASRTDHVDSEPKSRGKAGIRVICCSVRTMSQLDRARLQRSITLQGDRELRRTAFRFAEDFRELRLRVGVSQRAIAIAIGVDRSVITRLERGDPSVSPAVRARACAALGADFRMQLYHERAALIYDAGHARLVDRLVSMVGRGWRTELELALPGRRSVDACHFSPSTIVVAEVETRVRRLEQIQRELKSKQDSAIAQFGLERPIHVVLALPPTHHHRALIREHPALIRTAFPARSAQIRAALADAALPFPGDGILWVPGASYPSAGSPVSTS
jgi:transcriptional regulator with XRE-family HTH domain